MRRAGVLLVGALGHLATTVIGGSLALKRGLCPRTGMVTASDLFSGLDLIDPGSMVFGGWDIRRGSLQENAANLLLRTQLADGVTLSRMEEDLRMLDGSLFQGNAVNCGTAISELSENGSSDGCGPLLDVVDGIRSDIRKFRERNGVDLTVVVNLASTEPPLALEKIHAHLEAFQAALGRNDYHTVRASTLYAYAAIQENCPYINFTPSNGAIIPAILELAGAKRVPLMGNDGKTGETLVKSALAPMFRYRNLDVLSWEGFNILGNMDGRVLDNPENRKSKVRTKDHILKEILGYAPHSSVHINHVPSLGDQKTAWDFIHFEGFLRARMSLQFVWQGYDSILAAPLVLDLVRLVELAQRRGESGLLPHLASFFKEPLGVHEHTLHKQYQMLLDYVQGITGHP